MTNLRILLPAALLLALAACGKPAAAPGGSPGATSAAPAPLAVGQVGHASGVDLTVTDVSTPKQVGAGGIGPKAEAGETFVVVSFTIKNTSGKALPYPERPALTLVDGAGQSYEPDLPASLMAASGMADPSGMASDLNPGVSAKARAAWKVSAKAFDRNTWRLSAASDPQLAFRLK